MGNKATSVDNKSATSSDPLTRVQWMWNSSRDPFLESDSDDWRPYSDVENMIIEEAFATGEHHAMLDDYHIDFKHQVQISNNDINKQRPIKRLVCNRDDKRLREERFMPNPIAPNRPYSGRYGFISPFIKETVKDLNLKKEQLPSKNETIVPMIVEKAALGIIEEGKKFGKQREAEKLAEKLREKKEAGMKEVWKCCAYLYTMESFLYKKLNETMRVIGSEEHEQVWRSKVRTFGPFCLLLWDNPFNSNITDPGKILYRGAQLTDDYIASFKDDSFKGSELLRSFQAFTSCSRNRSEAEKFGNVLFIMQIQIAFTVDLCPLSEYSHEEEELVFPGVCFTIDRLEFDEHKSKHLIYLTLRQRHNRIDQQELNKDSSQPIQQYNVTNRLRRLRFDDRIDAPDGLRRLREDVLRDDRDALRRVDDRIDDDALRRFNAASCARREAIDRRAAIDDHAAAARAAATATIDLVAARRAAAAATSDLVAARRAAREARYARGRNRRNVLRDAAHRRADEAARRRADRAARDLDALLGADADTARYRADVSVSAADADIVRNLGILARDGRNEDWE